jgi:hypothetical protein
MDWLFSNKQLLIASHIGKLVQIFQRAGLWSRDQDLGLETVSRLENQGLGLGPFALGLGLDLMTRGPRSRPRPQFTFKMLVESFLDQCERFRNHDSLHGAIITLITMHCEYNV